MSWDIYSKQIRGPNMDSLVGGSMWQQCVHDLIFYHQILSLLIPIWWCWVFQDVEHCWSIIKVNRRVVSPKRKGEMFSNVCKPLMLARRTDSMWIVEILLRLKDLLQVFSYIHPDLYRHQTLLSYLYEAQGIRFSLDFLSILTFISYQKNIKKIQPQQNKASQTRWPCQ